MRIWTLFLILLITLAGCKKEFFGDDPANTPENNFEIFWNDFDRNYSQFMIRNLNWDSVYSVYRPQIHSNTTDKQLFNVLSELVFILNDLHVNLYTPYGTVFRKGYKLFGSYPSGRYINLSYYIDHLQANSIFNYGIVRNSNIGFIIIKTFSGEGSGTDLADKRYDFIDNILDQFKNTDGIILDVRSNQGGEALNVPVVAGRFADERRLYSKWCYKNGPGKNDFSDWQCLYVNPAGSYQYKKPVVVITSRTTASAAEDFVLAMKTFPNVTIVGDTTAGGIGLPVSRELPNGWAYRLSTAIAASADNYIIEGRGISPDVPIVTTVEDSVKHIDRLIEKGIETINMKINE